MIANIITAIIFFFFFDEKVRAQTAPPKWQRPNDSAKSVVPKRPCPHFWHRRIDRLEHLSTVSCVKDQGSASFVGTALKLRTVIGH